MKASEAYRAGVLVSAMKRWGQLERACRKKHSEKRGLEFLVGGLASDGYVDCHDVSIAVDCKTGAAIAAAAKKIIASEIKKLGVYQ